MFLRFIRWAGLVCGTWYKIVSDCMGVRRVGKCPFPPWKLGSRTKFIPKNLSRHHRFRLIDLILAMTVFLPVWNSHCTRVRFTVTVSCSDGLAVHSCLFLCLQRWVVKVARGADCSAVGLYCVTIPWQQTRKGSLYITVAGVLFLETGERRHPGK